jgi:hypothetical protein
VRAIIVPKEERCTGSTFVGGGSAVRKLEKLSLFGFRVDLYPAGGCAFVLEFPPDGLWRLRWKWRSTL